MLVSNEAQSFSHTDICEVIQSARIDGRIVHVARPDINCVAHSHSTIGRAFCTLGLNLDIITQDACAFHNDITLYANFRGAVLGPEEGEAIAKTLAQRKAALL